jgi:actin-like ATPase involved in cell morphogenesis
MNDTIAIDFGTMRTKVAYRDPNRNTLELMRLGQDERPFVPSLFFLGEDGRRLFGDDAAEYLDSDPLAFLPRPLKRELREQWVRAGNRVKATPTELLSLLFAGLRKRTNEIACFRDAPPTGVFLTVPAQYGPPDREILMAAARSAGFHEDRICFIDEPIAAAQAWLAEVGGKEEYVVVLDCGGGTLDWACLHRAETDRFDMTPEIPAGGDNRVGGVDVDEAIYAFVDDAITDEIARGELQTKRCLAREQIRVLKEKHSRTGEGGTLRIGNTPVHITSVELDNIITRRFISQACLNLTSYLEKVRSRTKIEKPTVLLVGGSARLRGLKDAVAEQGRCTAVWWERSEYATVLGALHRDTPAQAHHPDESTKKAVRAKSTRRPDTTMAPQDAIQKTQTSTRNQRQAWANLARERLLTVAGDSSDIYASEGNMVRAIKQLDPLARRWTGAVCEKVACDPDRYCESDVRVLAECAKAITQIALERNWDITTEAARNKLVEEVAKNGKRVLKIVRTLAQLKTNETQEGDDDEDDDGDTEREEGLPELLVDGVGGLLKGGIKAIRSLFG